MTQEPAQFLAERFERHRSRLRAIAYRILGSASDADDAVQEAWLRVSRSGDDEIANLESWLTTIVSRVCLTMLQARRSRAQPADPDLLHELAVVDDASDPEFEAVLADSIGLALLVVFETLTPAERVAFVLHDLFAIPFDQIASTLSRSPAATRQLASRARIRIRRREASARSDRIRQGLLVHAFLAAARNGDFHSLLALLDPEIVLRADDHALTLGAVRESCGAETVAKLSLRARGAVYALLDGAPAAAWLPEGKLRSILRFTIRDDKIAAIEVIADPDRLGRLNLTVPTKEI